MRVRLGECVAIKPADFEWRDAFSTLAKQPIGGSVVVETAEQLNALFETAAELTLEPAPPLLSVLQLALATNAEDEDEGRVAEMGPPLELRATPGTMFAKLCDAAETS